MSKAKRPSFERERAIEGLRKARETAIHIRSAHTARSGPRAVADQMVTLIDDLALLLLGDREFFHAKPHSLGVPTPRRD